MNAEREPAQTPMTPAAGDPAIDPVADVASDAATEAAALPSTDGPAIETTDLGSPAVPDAPPVVSDVTRPRRRTKVIAFGRRFLRFGFAVALFAVGVTLGVLTFQRIAPPPPVVGDLSTGGIATPPVVQELVIALESNDADALRSAVQGDPYRQIAAEMQTWDLKEVTTVETLATMQDGTKTATEIVIVGRRTADRAPVVFNLVVHVTDGSIVLFR